MTMYQHNDIPQDAQFDVIFLFTKSDAVTRYAGTY